MNDEPIDEAALEDADASREARASYARVRGSVAAALYVRNRMAGEVAVLRAELARQHDALCAALRRGDERVARALAEAKGICREDLESAERELAQAQRDAAEATTRLTAFHAAMRARARERLRARATEIAITVAAQCEADGDAVEARFGDLSRVP